MSGDIPCFPTFSHTITPGLTGTIGCTHTVSTETTGYTSEFAEAGAKIGAGLKITYPGERAHLSRIADLEKENAELRARLEMAEIRISARDEKIEVSAETIALLKGLEITRPVGPLPSNYAAQPPRNYAARLMARGEAD
jgi:hypothetical protein